MSRHCIPLVLVLLLPLAAAAGDIKTVVRKDAIAVSPVDARGMVTVSGPPGCVLGAAPLQVIAKNKKTDVIVSDRIAPDGSFAVRIPALPKHKIKLTFVGANGEDKKVTVKVPKTVYPIPPAPYPPATTERVRETITIPRGVPAPGRPAPSDSEIIRGERDFDSSGVIE